jgi:hypothetical protein
VSVISHAGILTPSLYCRAVNPAAFILPRTPI